MDVLIPCNVPLSNPVVKAVLCLVNRRVIYSVDNMNWKARKVSTNWLLTERYLGTKKFLVSAFHLTRNTFYSELLRKSYYTLKGRKGKWRKSLVLQWNLIDNEGLRDCQNFFAITRFRYIKVLFHILYYFTWVKKMFVIPSISLYRGSLYRGSTNCAFFQFRSVV